MSHTEKPVIPRFKQILEDLGIDMNDPNFQDTPSRVMRMYNDFFENFVNKEKLKREIEKLSKAKFPVSKSSVEDVGNKSLAMLDQLVTIKGHKCWGLCPHHLFPVEYEISVAYIAKEHFLGLSKLPRLVELLAKRPVLQEQLTRDIAETLTNMIDCMGTFVLVFGRHTCMAARGIRSHDSRTITSSITGIFREDLTVKDEVLKLIKMRGLDDV